MNDMFICRNKFQRFTPLWPSVLPLFIRSSHTISSLFRSICLLLCNQASHLNSVRMEYIKVKSSHCVSLITIFCCFLQNTVIVCLVWVYHLVRLAWACVCAGACAWIETEISKCETETETRTQTQTQAQNEWSWTKWLKEFGCVGEWQRAKSIRPKWNEARVSVNEKRYTCFVNCTTYMILFHVLCVCMVVRNVEREREKARENSSGGMVYA